MISNEREIGHLELYETMGELAIYQYDPKEYEERVRECLSWNTSDGDEDGS